MITTELLAESWRAFRSSPVAALLIALLTAGMGAISIASAGANAATYTTISVALSSPEARTFKITEAEQTVLTSTVLDLVSSVSSVEHVLAMTTPTDVIAGNLGHDSTPVPMSHIAGDVDTAIVLTAGRMPARGEAIIGPKAQQQLRLVDGVGYVETSAGRQLSIVGTFAARAPFTDLDSYVIATDRVPGYARLHAVAKNLETLPAMEHAVSSIVGEHLGVKIVKDSASASAKESLQLMGVLRSDGTVHIAQTIGAGLLIVFGVVFADVLLHARDLGRRRTLGVTRSNLIAFVQLKVAYSAICGAVLGSVGTHVVLYVRGVNVPPSFTLATVVLTVAAAAFAAIIPGIVAAYRDPITVMRTHV